MRGVNEVEMIEDDRKIWKNFSVELSREDVREIL
jgi:hypothetical protein